ncbi:Thioredoxin domain-containing protein 5, partial [Smittium culicis]
KRYDESQHSVVLSSANFKESVSSGTWFIKFYSPRCGYSKKLAPIWSALSTDLFENAKKNGIRFGEVDCLANSNVCDDQNVDGYPTLFIYNRGKQIEEYGGANVYDELLSYSNQLATRFK